MNRSPFLAVALAVAGCSPALPPAAGPTPPAATATPITTATPPSAETPTPAATEKPSARVADPVTPPEPPRPMPGGDADRATCRAEAADAASKRARYEACKAACSTNAYELCEPYGDLADELQIAVYPDNIDTTPVFGWSQACVGAKSDSACTKRDARLAKVKAACPKATKKTIDACFAYAASLTYAPWSAAVKKEQEDMYERLCFLDSTKSCMWFAGLTINMEPPLRARAGKALAHACDRGDGKSCCALALAHEAPGGPLGVDARKADGFEARAVKAGYAQCPGERAAQRKMAEPPVIEAPGKRPGMVK